MHGTGQCCTNIHRFQVVAVFYPNFYPKGQPGDVERLFLLVMAAKPEGDQSVSPAFQAGHAGSIPVARSSSSRILDLVFAEVLFRGRLPDRKAALAMFRQLNCNPRT
jgi:hypothetical protein